MQTRFFIFVAASLLAACASPPASDTAAVAGKPVQQEGAASLKGDVQTGSRLNNRGTDRTVRSVGNQTYRDDNIVRSIGNEVATPGR